MTEETKRAAGRPAKAPEPTAQENLENNKPGEDYDELALLKAELEKLRAEKKQREESESTDAPKGKFLIHFLEDGLTLLGKPTYRGMELEFDTESQAYKDTEDINGFSVLEWRRNPQAQREYFGKIMFLEGPWTGKSFAEIKYEAIKQLAADGNGKEGVPMKELMELEKLDAKRRRVPEPFPLTSGVPMSRRSG